MNRSTSDGIDPNPGPVAHRVLHGFWVLWGVAQILLGNVWLGIFTIVGFIGVAAYYERSLRRRRAAESLRASPDAQESNDS